MGRRMVAPARAIVEALTPSTWSVAIGRPRVGAKSCATTQCSGPPSGRNPIRDSTSSPSTETTPPVANTSTGSGARAFRAEASEIGTPMTKSRNKVSRVSVGTCRAVQRGELTAGEVREHVGPETFGQRIEREPGVVQDAADPPRRFGTFEEAHRLHRARCSAVRGKTPQCSGTVRDRRRRYQT